MAELRNGLARALAGGAAGATTVTLVHETVRRLRPDAPRMDVLGMRGLAGTLRKMGRKPPPRDQLHAATLVADLLSNGLYFSLIGAGRGERAWMRGAILGLGAGIGGVLLPPLMGLGSRPSRRTPQTKAMTVAWYLLGGLAAAAAYRALAKPADSDAVDQDAGAGF